MKKEVTDTKKWGLAEVWGGILDRIPMLRPGVTQVTQGEGTCQEEWCTLVRLTCRGLVNSLFSGSRAKSHGFSCFKGVPGGELRGIVPEKEA